MTSKPKIVKSITELRNEQVSKVQEKGLRKLNELFDALWEEAQGIKFLVTPTNRRNTLPKNADKLDEGFVIDHICPKCKQPVIKDPPEFYEVWKERRDSTLLRYLYDQQVGKSGQKDREVVDPEIIIIFDAIDSIESESTELINSSPLLTAPVLPALPTTLGLPTT